MLLSIHSYRKRSVLFFAILALLIFVFATSNFVNDNTSQGLGDPEQIYRRKTLLRQRRREATTGINTIGHGDTGHHDMAILIAYFNPIGYKRTIMNVLYVINTLRAQGLPLFVAEVSLQGRPYTLAPEQRHLSVKTDSILFYKENIFNMLERTLPSRYKKLVLLDCDIVFADDDWYSKTSALLETHDVVQPFHTAQWMSINYTTVLRERPSYLNISCFLTTQQRDQMKSAPPSHEGFAWAFRRPLFQAMGGMPEFAVLTGGDTIVALAVSPIAIRTRFFLHQLAYLRTSVESYNLRAQAAFDMFGVVPGSRTTAATPGIIRHLFHGSRSRRRYDLFAVHKMFINMGFTLNATYVDVNGLYRYHTPDRWNAVFYEYFASRLEDEVV